MEPIVTFMNDLFGSDGTVYVLMGIGIVIWTGAGYYMMENYKKRLKKRIKKNGGRLP